MKLKHLKVWVSVLLVMVFCTPPCFAEATGFLYAVAYSYKDKRAYCSAIFTAKVRDKSYSDEEYVTDMEVLQKTETAFEQHLVRIISGQSSRYTISARGAYKSFAIAKKKLDAEIIHYTNLKMTVEKEIQIKLKK